MLARSAIFFLIAPLCYIQDAFLLRNMTRIVGASDAPIAKALLLIGEDASSL
jgi:hypothetical protein